MFNAGLFELGDGSDCFCVYVSRGRV